MNVHISLIKSLIYSIYNVFDRLTFPIITILDGNTEVHTLFTNCVFQKNVTFSNDEVLCESKECLKLFD